MKLVVQVAATGVVFDDILKNSFIEFIIIIKLFFVKDLMFFRCYWLGWGGIGRRGEEGEGHEAVGGRSGRG